MQLKYKYKLSYFFVASLAKIISIFPLKFNVRAAQAFSKVFYRVLSSRRKVAIDNIRSAFPDYPEDKINQIAYKSFENIAVTFIEMLYLPNMSKEEVMNHVKYEKPELLLELYNQNKGLLLLSAHYGNWEFMAYSGKYHLGIDMLIPVKLLKNWFVDKYINNIRTSNGNRVINMDKSAMEIIKQLRNHKAVALLVDQSAHQNLDVFVQMFGRPTLTYKAPAELALKYNIPMTFNVPERQPDGTYLVKSQEIKYEDLKFDKNGIHELTQRHTKALEKQLTENPYQWAWMHKRWKHTPADEAN